MSQAQVDHNLSKERPAAGAQAVLYLRVASPYQEDQQDGIVQQRGACIRQAERLGAVIMGEFVDAGVCGNTRNRRGLRGLLRRITTWPVSYVITRDATRLARNPRLYTSIKQRLCRAGVTLAFADDGATSEVSLVL